MIFCKRPSKVKIHNVNDNNCKYTIVNKILQQMYIFGRKVNYFDSKHSNQQMATNNVYIFCKKKNVFQFGCISLAGSGLWIVCMGQERLRGVSDLLA